MPTLTVRQLDEAVYAGLKDVADRAGRSMEAEARRILEEAVRSRTWWDRWVAATEPLRGDDLPIPPRSLPREVDLS
jgi:plasmid stability protein